jgi:hypothetical protein
MKMLPFVLLNTYRLYEKQYQRSTLLKNYLSSRIIEMWGNNLQTKYCENPTDYSQCDDHVNEIRMTHPPDLQSSGGVIYQTITC